MLIIENIRMAVGSLRAGKMRALLTMLGIIIGIGSVIAIMTGQLFIDDIHCGFFSGNGS